MEVHHPHHPTHKKKWPEYIIEFVMLFAAVTLGFFAENQREHFVERHREHQYMESILEDLKNDKIEISAARKYTNTQIANIDTAIELLTIGNWTPDNIKKMYIVSLKTGGNRPITFIDRTSSQLKNGGMRLIEDKKVSTLISEYWQLIAHLLEYESYTTNNNKLSIKNLTYKIIDGTKYLDVKNKIIKDDAILLSYDPVLLKEYNNRLINLKFDLKYFTVNTFYDRIDEKNEELQKEIMIKYQIK